MPDNRNTLDELYLSVIDCLENGRSILGIISTIITTTDYFSKIVRYHRRVSDGWKWEVAVIVGFREYHLDKRSALSNAIIRHIDTQY
jgi:hypothetical protein